MAPVLFISVFIIATCGLIYELVAGALASYILGDSITQFSLIIGLYLSAMGVGSYLSRFIERNLLARFIEIEFAVAIIGGSSATLLFMTVHRPSGFSLLLFALVSLTGILVGLEIPLLIRILEEDFSLKEVVSRVLALDYVGALVASLLFPIVLLPKLGLLRTGLLFGILNALVGLWGTTIFDGPRGSRLRLQAMGVVTSASLILGFGLSGRMVSLADARLFADEIVLKVTSPYQTLVMTRYQEDLRLFINNNLQFSSMDEYRYHEALVHPAVAATPSIKEVMILGGGDGLALREVLTYPEVEAVTLVDLDPEMTRLFQDIPMLKALNKGALDDPRVEIINADAYQWLESAEKFYDLVIIDFPDPNNHGLGKLYTTSFYRLLKRRLSQKAVMVVQSSSPYFTPNSFWCVANTLEAEGFHTRPYHAYVPSFGEWGFILAGASPIPDDLQLRAKDLRFLSQALMPSLFEFPPDMAWRETPINRLDNQILVQMYEEEWGKVL